MTGAAGPRQATLAWHWGRISLPEGAADAARIPSRSPEGLDVARRPCPARQAAGASRSACTSTAFGLRATSAVPCRPSRCGSSATGERICRKAALARFKCEDATCSRGTGTGPRRRARLSRMTAGSGRATSPSVTRVGTGFSAAARSTSSRPAVRRSRPWRSRTSCSSMTPTSRSCSARASTGG